MSVDVLFQIYKICGGLFMTFLQNQYKYKMKTIYVERNEYIQDEIKQIQNEI